MHLLLLLQHEWCAWTKIASVHNVAQQHLIQKVGGFLMSLSLLALALWQGIQSGKIPSRAVGAVIGMSDFSSSGAGHTCSWGDLWLEGMSRLVRPPLSASGVCRKGFCRAAKLLPDCPITLLPAVKGVMDKTLLCVKLRFIRLYVHIM